MTEETKIENTCACKGIRRCLLCEVPNSQHNQDSAATVVFLVLRHVILLLSLGAC